MRKAGVLYCNCCGKTISESCGADREEFFHFEKTWGYFSADICESCFEQWMSQFRIPPQTVERTEIFEC